MNYPKLADLDGIKRVVVWFSAGVTSAVAGKIAADTFRSTLPVVLVNTDTGSEDDDNHRFMSDVAKWLDLPLIILHNEKYSDAMDVYKKTRFFKNQAGARCTLELKKKMRWEYEDLRHDLQVFGFDADETDRTKRFVSNNPEVRVWFPLVEHNINKTQARSMLLGAGIQEPRTYAEGFRNANCLNTGCIKGRMGYWNHIRKMRPNVFWNMAQMERELDHALCIKVGVDADGKRRQLPIFLDELGLNDGNYKSEPAIQCGLFCGEF